ncbi:MAG: nitrile hydratase accessory protein [Gammaproteobacteria bacterium]
MDNRKLIAKLSEISSAPRDVNKEITFQNPWEAKVFALVVQLHQEEHYNWNEWAEQLSAEIKSAGEQQSGEDYYHLWLKAAESLVVKKGLCEKNELLNQKNRLKTAQEIGT